MNWDLCTTILVIKQSWKKQRHTYHCHPEPFEIPALQRCPALRSLIIWGESLLLAFAVRECQTNTDFNTVQVPLNLPVISHLSTLLMLLRTNFLLVVLAEGCEGNHVFRRSLRPLTTLAILKPCATGKRMTCI